MATSLIYDPIYLEHNTGPHPENAGRLESTMRAVSDSGLLELLEMTKPKAATVQEIATVHSTSYIVHVRRVAEMGGGFLDPDTYVSPRSYDVALLAVGGADLAMEQVVTGEVDTAFALVRPPGHHALASRGMGFCLFNNIAIATRLAQMRHGLKRILILDFDVHHGNGTQTTFWMDNQVLYFSVHEYPFYPGTGSLNEIGEGEGRGYTINVPLPAGVGDDGYLRVFREVLTPAARRFQPQVIAVSAGYDAHWADPIATMRMSITGYAQMAVHLRNLAKELCDGRLVFCLEGGYNHQALAHSVVATLQVLTGRSFTDPVGPPTSLHSEPSVDPIIQQVKTLHNLA